MDILYNINADDIFKDLFEHSTVGMSVTSLDNKLHPNAAFCEMIGYTREELTSKKWADYTHKEDIEYNNEVIFNILNGGKKSFRWEKRYLHKNGSVIWADIHTFLHCDSEGKPLYFITTVNDITKRRSLEEEIKEQNEQLQQSNIEKDKFFAILAHDLRSPICSFLGLAEVMAEESNTMTMSEIEEISKSLFISASNLYQLLENLLEWSVLRKGYTNCIPEASDLNKIITRAMEPFRESANRKKIHFSFLADPSFQVLCDLKMTETILRNLFSNALKYTHGHGEVTISTSALSGNMARISVTDSGIGMSEDLLSKLFKLNEQVCRKGTEGEASSGLGLLICKEFAELQGGRIWAESKEDQGSTFHFSLRLAD
jgi:PAS domain S-box-containing protein